MCIRDRGCHRRLLQARKQGLARLRRGPQQQDPRHPAPRLRSTRPGISAAQGAHMHASSALKLPKTPTRLPEDPDFMVFSLIDCFFSGVAIIASRCDYILKGGRPIWVKRFVSIELPGGPLSVVGPI